METKERASYTANPFQGNDVTSLSIAGSFSKDEVLVHLILKPWLITPTTDGIMQTKSEKNNEENKKPHNICTDFKVDFPFKQRLLECLQKYLKSGFLI